MASKPSLLRFASLLRPHVGAIALVGALVLAFRILSVPAPMLQKGIVDGALTRGNGAELARYIGLYAAVLIVSRLLAFGVHAMSARVQQSVLHDARLAIYEHLQRLDLGFYRRNPTGGLLSRIMSDVSQVQGVLSRELFEIAASFVQVVVVAVLLVKLNPGLTGVAALVFPVLILLLVVFQKRFYALSRLMQERREALSAKLQENLAGNRVVQTLAIEPQRMEVTRQTSCQMRNTIVRTEVLGAGANLLTISLTEIPLTLLVWGYGGYQVLAGSMSIGGLIAFYQYLLMLYDPVIRILRFNIDLQVARAAVDRVYEVLDTPPVVADRPDAAELHVRHGRIALQELSVRYAPELPLALEDITLEIGPGEVLGIVGPSGAGKTTLVYSLLRFVDPVRGAICIDGQDLRDLSLRSLRRSIGVVPQEIFLFRDTIAANIAMGKPGATPAEIEHAAKLAHAHEFIMATTDGYGTLVGEGGLGLSGGERQRIALARTFLQDPHILVLDEATSSLDSRSESLIQQVLAKLVEGRTTLIVAHRLATLNLCTRIAVLSGGRLAEVGTREELSARDGLFRALLRAQLLGDRTSAASTVSLPPAAEPTPS